MFCKCKRKQTKKSAQAKDYEMDSVRPSIVSQQANQAPPPYYPASGLDNKALEHSMDLALALEEQKSAIYAAQNGYGYGSGLQVPSHNIPADCKFTLHTYKNKSFLSKKR
jgi:echinoid